MRAINHTSTDGGTVRDRRRGADGIGAGMARRTSRGNAGGAVGAARRSSMLIDSVATVLLAGCAIALIGLGAGLMNLNPGASPLSKVEYLAGIGAAAVGTLLALWWIVGAALALWLAVIAKHVQARPGRPASGAWLVTLSLRVAPTFMRRLAAALIGISIVSASTVTTSFAAPSTSMSVALPAAPSPLFEASQLKVSPLAEFTADPNSTTDASLASAPDPNPLWTPEADQVSGSAVVPDSTRDTQSVMQPGSQVVVDVGDTLWALAAQQLGGFASDADIAALWPAWYQANASTIGTDPNTILPGQILTIPELPGTQK